MDVRCERCSTEYEFDDALVSDKGTTVKCMSCGHQFRVQRPSALKAPDKWLVRRPGGEELVFVSLRELQKAIAAHQVGKEDHLFRGALRARALGSIPELQPFFDRAARPATKATSRGLGMPPPAGAPAPPPPTNPLPSMSMTQPFALGATAAVPTPPPPAPRPGSLPSLNEPIPPLQPASPATPLPPPRASTPPAPPRTQTPPPVAAVKSAPPPAVNVVKSAPPPAVQAQPLRSAPPPHVAPLPTPLPPINAIKSAPPPPIKSAPPPVAKPLPTPPPTRTEALPPMSAPVPDEPLTQPVIAPPERSPKPRPASSDPPARSTKEASERPAARTRSVPPDLEASLPVRRDPGITRWIVAGSVLGITALLAGTLGRKYVAGLGPGGAASPSGTSISAPPGTTAGAVATAATPPAAVELLAAAEKSFADGDLEGAKETLVRASALAPQDSKILIALARVATTKADVSWLRLRLLPKTATDARRVASTELGDAAKRAKTAAEAATATAPDAIDTLRLRVDALRLSDDVAGARTLTARLAAGTPTPENAFSLAALDLAGEEPPNATTLERLRLATSTDGGAGRARALLVFALARVGDPDGAHKELEKLAALPRPFALLPELRALVAATKPNPLGVAAASATAPVDIGKLPTVVPGPAPKADDTGYKINDAPPAKPDATAAPPAKPDATAAPPAKPDAPPAPPTKADVTAAPKGDPKPAGTKGKAEFSEEELHRKLFGDQPK